MEDEDILALPVERLVAEHAHLYLWLVAAKAELAYSVCRAWGFRPVMELWWLKRLPQMLLPLRGALLLPPRTRQGLGFYFRHVGERCLFGTRGKGRLLRRDLDAIVVEPGREHSRKPEGFYRLVERASPGPRLELFARQRRPGWVCWGDEAGKFRA